ncbi:M23 family metallopeptidase [Cohnella sp.]|uniref:M23 family metallopeptidase n=1 Tax=Cohnella sp. TaxID=1883426 RepID=UPI003568120C
MRMIFIASALALGLALSGCASGEQEQDMKPEDVPQALLDRKYGQIHSRFTDGFKQAVGEADLRQVADQVVSDISSWKPMAKQSWNGGEYYGWADDSGKWGLILTTEETGRIDSLLMMPVQPYPDTDAARTKSAYGLPFTGEWTVFWGGENVFENYHYAVDSQRYAYDLVQVRDGYTYQGDKTKNESYYAFGQPIVAPRDGTVAAVVDGIADNEPVGRTDPENPAGNVVVIDHGDGEFSILAHLQKGSVSVQIGDKLSKGDQVGLCGNSGNSSEPHLHFQVSDGKELFDSKSIRVHWEQDRELRQGAVVDGG